MATTLYRAPSPTPGPTPGSAPGPAPGQAMGAARPAPAPAGLLARAGDWLRRHQHAVRLAQWCVIAVYLVLLLVPPLLPLPERSVRLLDHFTLVAQFVFWGLWWPGVLVSILLFGRLWCGVLCPEGALTEWASRHGKGRAIPRWLRWKGWPLAAFLSTTVYGQLVSVYQYPRPAALILGGSTLAAIAVGYFYGREKRVWCRYLCPVSGVFAILSRLAPMHYAVDRDRWDASSTAQARRTPVNCAPLVPIRTMADAPACHMCGRCSGFRGAIELAPRLPGAEIMGRGRDFGGWETALLLVGLIGVATGAFQWSASPWFVQLKLQAATALVERGILWPLTAELPWWLLTNYAERGDVMSVLDGALLLAYIAATAATLALALAGQLSLAARLLGPWRWPRFHHLAQALIPTAACGLILGLSSLTVSLLRPEGVPLGWVADARLALLAASFCAGVFFSWRIAARHGASRTRRAAATAVMVAAQATACAPWLFQFVVW